MFQNPFGSLPYGYNPYSQSSITTTGNLWADDNVVWNLADRSLVQSLPETRSLFGNPCAYGPGAIGNTGFFASLVQSQAQQNAALMASMSCGNSSSMGDMLKFMMMMRAMKQMDGNGHGSESKSSDTRDLQQFASLNPGQYGNAVLRYGSLEEFSKNNYKDNMTVDDALKSLGADSKGLSDTDKSKILKFLGKDSSSASLTREEYKRLMEKFGFSPDKSEIKRSDMHYDDARKISDPPKDEKADKKEDAKKTGSTGSSGKTGGSSSAQGAGSSSGSGKAGESSTAKSGEKTDTPAVKAAKDRDATTAKQRSKDVVDAQQTRKEAYDNLANKWTELNKAKEELANAERELQRAKENRDAIAQGTNGMSHEKEDKEVEAAERKVSSAKSAVSAAEYKVSVAENMAKQAEADVTSTQQDLASTKPTDWKDDGHGGAYSSEVVTSVPPEFRGGGGSGGASNSGHGGHGGASSY